MEAFCPANIVKHYLRFRYFEKDNRNLDDVALYEFEDVPYVRSSTGHLLQADLFNLVESKALKTLTYRGAELLNRLASVPVVDFSYRIRYKFTKMT